MKHRSYDSRSKIQDSGFTLIETIIYVALISIMMALSLSTVYQILESQGRSRAKIEIEEEINFIMRKIEWSLTGIEQINQPVSNATSTTLSVNKINFSNNPLVFTITSGDVFLSQGSGGPIPLNSSRVNFNSLIFEHIPVSGGSPAAIKIDFSINDQASIETTIYLRK